MPFVASLYIVRLSTPAFGGDPHPCPSPWNGEGFLYTFLDRKSFTDNADGASRTSNPRALLADKSRGGGCAEEGRKLGIVSGPGNRSKAFT